MVKILSKSGDSLADTYDVEGSVAGIEQLETRELPIVHEMGATIFSERFSTFIRKFESGDILQSANFGIIIDDLPAHPFRIFGIQLFVDQPSRLQFASLAIRDAGNGREMPIFAWDSATDITINVRFSDDGAGAGLRRFLQPAASSTIVPHMIAGLGQPQHVSDLAFRGVTLGFGAGTVQTTALVHIGFSRVAGISSRGLPIPSW